MSLEDRTAKALTPEVMAKLRSLSFCVIGCSGTGANFAEMLVRTGARRLTLIDGAEVKESDLNRVFCYCSSDVDTPKVEALKRRLLAINDKVDVHTVQDTFPVSQQTKDAVCGSDIVFIATDTNRSRIAIIDFCRIERKETLSAGVFVDRESGVYELECQWNPRAPREKKDAEGYGPRNASVASLLLEATSVAFTMLLSHLTSERSIFVYFFKKYDKNLQAVECQFEPTNQ